MQNKTRTLALLFAAAVIAVAQLAVADSKKPVRIGVNQEPAQQVTAHLAGNVLKDAGYKVTFVELDAGDMAAALRTGEIHAQPEWPADDPGLKALLDSGDVIDVGRRNSEDDEPEIRKLVWSGLKRPWPGAHKLFGNMTYPSADQANMVAAIEDGAALESVVEQWLRENRDRWRQWKSVTKNWMKP